MLGSHLCHGAQAASPGHWTHIPAAWGFGGWDLWFSLAVSMMYTVLMGVFPMEMLTQENWKGWC